jgi:molybdopterin-guanine dinucleotide biosynthesis protein A
MGAAKATLPFGPEALLQRVVRLVGGAAGPIVVVAADGQDLPALPEGVIVARDPVADRGPLFGLLAGLEALPASTVLAYATATDAPFLRPAWVEHLASLVGDHDAAVVRDGGYPHPLAAVYRVAATVPAIEALGRDGRSRLRDLIDAIRTNEVPAGAMRGVDPELATLRNLNTPEDYRAALREAGFEPAGLGGGSPP